MRIRIMSLIALGGFVIAGTAGATPPDDQPPPRPPADPVPDPDAAPTWPPPLANPPDGPDQDPDVPDKTININVNAPPPPPAVPQPVPPIEVVPVPSMPDVGWYGRRLVTGIGVGLTIGGGLSGFTDRTMREALTSDVGGMWDFHASLGTHTPIGVELGYMGSVAGLQSFAGASNGTLVGTAAEFDLRWNVLPNRPWTPFFFGGIGWQHYSTFDTMFSAADSGMKSSDDVAEFPMGAGLSFRDIGGFTFDIRGTFRATTASTLLFDPRTGHYADLDTWQASAALGYEF